MRETTQEYEAYMLAKANSIILEAEKAFAKGSPSYSYSFTQVDNEELKGYKEGIRGIIESHGYNVNYSFFNDKLNIQKPQTKKKKTTK